jgi:predicted small secreted protein
MMKKLAPLTLAVTALMLAGCNTVAGAGKDVSSAGHAVTKAAKPVN